jgi:hypothetical protein
MINMISTSENITDFRDSKIFSIDFDTDYKSKNIP